MIKNTMVFLALTPNHISILSCQWARETALYCVTRVLEYPNNIMTYQDDISAVGSSTPEETIKIAKLASKPAAFKRTEQGEISLESRRAKASLRCDYLVAQQDPPKA
eukprot:GHVP01019564.1.p2 GENE.GHVP01019564.1~~GHVP01019564.1.p2  ORF type:complete len:107 (-),score=13.37 GHVP01019564.1:626-946(-)